jgi:RNA polymerase sigma-70 factor (ECF subfamily)
MLQGVQGLTGEVSGLEDSALVARCRDGSGEAWAELVERYSRYVYAIVSRGFRLSEHDAEDVFQETFARTYEHLDGLRDDAALKPFIAQTARRLAIDRHRAMARVEPREEAPEPEADVEAELDRIDEALTVREAMRTLSEDCREILDRFFARDESYRTISDALDIPQGTIASRISRCLAKLRSELEADHR